MKMDLMMEEKREQHEALRKVLSRDEENEEDAMELVKRSRRSPTMMAMLGDDDDDDVELDESATITSKMKQTQTQNSSPELSTNTTLLQSQEVTYVKRNRADRSVQEEEEDEEEKGNARMDLNQEMKVLAKTSSRGRSSLRKKNRDPLSALLGR